MSERTDIDDKKLAKKIEAKEKRNQLDERTKTVLFYFRTNEHYKLTTRERGCDSGALVALVMRKLIFRRLDLEDADTWVYELTEKGRETVAKEAAKESDSSRPEVFALAA